MTDATNDLVNPWTDAVRAHGSYKAVDQVPLLVMLQNAVRSSTGGTAAGATDPAERNTMNLEAFELREQITQEVLMLTRKHTKDRPNPMLGYAVRHLAEKLDALRNSSQVTEHDYLYAIRRAKSWRERIWGLMHKPGEKELDFCPACNVAKVTNADGEIQAALVAHYSQDAEPVAKCRHCGTEWEGQGQLLVLGRMIGATADQDTLDEMGIKTPE